MLRAEDYCELGARYLKARGSIELFGAVEQMARERIGFKLLTMLHLSSDGEEVRRLYTTDPVHYPVSGREKLGRTAWGQRVLVEQQPYLGVDSAGVRWAFPADFDLISSLGLGSTMNVPIVALGKTLGSLNILNVAHAYDQRHMAAAISLAPYLTAAFLREMD